MKYVAIMVIFVAATIGLGVIADYKRAPLIRADLVQNNVLDIRDLILKGERVAYVNDQAKNRELEVEYAEIGNDSYSISFTNPLRTDCSHFSMVFSLFDEVRVDGAAIDKNKPENYTCEPQKSVITLIQGSQELESLKGL